MSLYSPCEHNKDPIVCEFCENEQCEHGEELSICLVCHEKRHQDYVTPIDTTAFSHSSAGEATAPSSPSRREGIPLDSSSPFATDPNQPIEPLDTKTESMEEISLITPDNQTLSGKTRHPTYKDYGRGNTTNSGHVPHDNSDEKHGLTNNAEPLFTGAEPYNGQRRPSTVSYDEFKQSAEFVNAGARKNIDSRTLGAIILPPQQGAGGQSCEWLTRCCNCCPDNACGRNCMGWFRGIAERLKRSVGDFNHQGRISALKVLFGAVAFTISGATFYLSMMSDRSDGLLDLQHEDLFADDTQQADFAIALRVVTWIFHINGVYASEKAIFNILHKLVTGQHKGSMKSKLLIAVTSLAVSTFSTLSVAQAFSRITQGIDAHGLAVTGAGITQGLVALNYMRKMSIETHLLYSLRNDEASQRMHYLLSKAISFALRSDSKALEYAYTTLLCEVTSNSKKIARVLSAVIYNQNDEGTAIVDKGMYGQLIKQDIDVPGSYWWKLGTIKFLQVATAVTGGILYSSAHGDAGDEIAEFYDAESWLTTAGRVAYGTYMASVAYDTAGSLIAGAGRIWTKLSEHSDPGASGWARECVRTLVSAGPGAAAITGSLALEHASGSMLGSVGRPVLQGVTALAHAAVAANAPHSAYRVMSQDPRECVIAWLEEQRSNLLCNYSTEEISELYRQIIPAENQAGYGAV